jgi:serine/threonine-protein kinase
VLDSDTPTEDAMPEDWFHGKENLGELAASCTAVVYKVRSLPFNRLNALKTLVDGAAAHSWLRQRKFHEAQVMASLDHPNIVSIHEVGGWLGRPYLLLELVEGGNLAGRLDGTPWPARQAAELVEKTALGLHRIHQQGLVHRDVTPGHILLTEQGEPKLVGFGLARAVGEFQRGIIVGTPEYLAPEVASDQADQIGPASDTFALGAVLYELLAGRPPFKADSPLQTLVRVVNDEPVPPSRLQPQMPADLEAICLTSLAKDPGRRYATAEALAEDLLRFMKGRPIQARPAGRGWRWWAGLMRRRS